MILPVPSEVRKRSGRFKVDQWVEILVPEIASGSDLFLASFLSAELANQHGVPLRIHRVAAIPKGQRFILMGSISNPLVREYCAAQSVHVNSGNPGTEGYVLDANDQSVAVLGSDESGAFYGLQTLRQILDWSDEGLSVQAQQVIDSPFKPFRGIYLYLPGRRHMPYFKRFIREVMAFYKFNKLIVEVDAGMQFERHPELNAGWIDFAKDMRYTRRERSAEPSGQYQDSANSDCADGGVLEKDEVAELVQYCRRYYIDVIPEIATLTHSYYLLTRHRELAAVEDAQWPDTYFPLPATYKLVFDVMDEYIEAMKPRMVHIGHDEWRIPWGLCSRCQGKDPRILYAHDVNELYSYLKGRNIEVAMWGDHLLEQVRGKRFRHARSPKGVPYEMPGALSPQQVRQLIPKDILVFNWFWNDTKRGHGEANDIELQDFGFSQVYGNLTPEIKDYERRSHRKSVLGGAPSSWAATTDFNFGKDVMYDILGCSNLVWSTHQLDPRDISGRVQTAMPRLRKRVTMELIPSDDNPTDPVDITAHLNAPTSSNRVPGINFGSLRNGRVRVGTKVFDLVSPDQSRGKKAVVVASGEQAAESAAEAVIPIGTDVSSVLFLHASSRAAQNFAAYYATWDYADTADLLGYYHFVYEDGLVETAPIRYGVNILEVGWGERHKPRNIAYQADLIDCGGEPDKHLTFFAFEWLNPRFGKPLREVHLKGISAFRNVRNQLIPGNSIILLAVSMVRKRSPTKDRARRSPWSQPAKTVS